MTGRTDGVPLDSPTVGLSGGDLCCALILMQVTAQVQSLQVTIMLHSLVYVGGRAGPKAVGHYCAYPSLPQVRIDTLSRLAKAVCSGSVSATTIMMCILIKHFVSFLVILLVLFKIKMRSSC